jgi:hypothetical protein
MSESQRAMIAARLANMPVGGGGNQYTGPVHSPNLGNTLVSTADAAEKLNVGRGSVENAKKLIASVY